MSIDSAPERKPSLRFSKIDTPLFEHNLGMYHDKVVSLGAAPEQRDRNSGNEAPQEAHELDELDQQADKLGSFALAREREDLPLPEDDAIVVPIASGRKKKPTIRRREVQPLEGEVDPYWNSEPDPSIDKQPFTSNEDFMAERKRLREEALERRAEGDLRVLAALKQADQNRRQKV